MIFIICEINQRVTDKFEEFNDDLCERHWYLYPIELQRIYAMFGVDTQQPVNIRGYGNIVCTRDTLKCVSSNFVLHSSIFKKKINLLNFQCFVLDNEYGIFLFYATSRNNLNQNYEKKSMLSIKSRSVEAL